jgi:hypothetical protein
MLPSSSVAVVSSWWHCLHLFLPPSVPWMATSGDGPMLLLRDRQSWAALLLTVCYTAMLRCSSVVFLKVLADI